MSIFGSGLVGDGNAPRAADKIFEALQEMQADWSRRQEAEARRLKGMAAFHGIRIIESPRLPPDEIEIHVGRKVYRMINLLPAQGKSAPEQPPEEAAR